MIFRLFFFAHLSHKIYGLNQQTKYFNSSKEQLNLAKKNSSNEQKNDQMRKNGSNEQKIFQMSKKSKNETIKQFNYLNLI